MTGPMGLLRGAFDQHPQAGPPPPRPQSTSSSYQTSHVPKPSKTADAVALELDRLMTRLVVLGQMSKSTQSSIARSEKVPAGKLPEVDDSRSVPIWIDVMRTDPKLRAVELRFMRRSFMR